MADQDGPPLASSPDYLRKVRGPEPKTREGSLLGGRGYLDYPAIFHSSQFSSR